MTIRTSLFVFWLGLTAVAGGLLLPSVSLANGDGESLLVNERQIIQHDQALQESAGFPNANQTTVSQIVANIIRTIIGFTGVIFVVLMVWGGLMWMSSAGSEDKISKAKKLIAAGIIGLVITISAYAITSLVLSTFFGSTFTISL